MKNSQDRFICERGTIRDFPLKLMGHRVKGATESAIQNFHQERSSSLDSKSLEFQPLHPPTDTINISLFQNDKNGPLVSFFGLVLDPII